MSYPDINSKSFYKELLAKKEIKDFKTNKVIPIRRVLEPQQKLLRNYISPHTPYENLLIFHETGVGKTGAAIAIAEQFKEHLEASNTRILVLVKNETIIKNFKSELTKEIFTNDNYVDSKTRSDLRKASAAVRLNILKGIGRKIAKVYEFMTYGTFVNRTIGRRKAAKLIDKVTKKSKRVIQGTPITNLDNRVIIIDEAHNLAGNDGYLALRKVLDDSIGTRVVLLSATPAFDNVGQIAEVMNLVLDRDSQLPDRVNKKERKKLLIPKKLFDKTKVTKPGQLNVPLTIPVLSDSGPKLLRNAAKGTVSYLRVNPATFPKRIEKGTPISDRKGSIRVVKCVMSEYQWKAVKKAILKDQKTKETSSPPPENFQSQSPSKKSVGFKNASDASTFVSPFTDSNGVGLFGSTGFKATFPGGNVAKSIQKELTGDRLKKYSCKIYRMIQLIRTAPGPVFVFSGFVTEGGVSLVSKLLALNGFAPLNSTSNKPKFAVLSGDTEPGVREKIRIRFNKPDNKKGKDIKILLATPVFSEGVTLKNVSQIHILEPAWNMSRLEQVIGRGIRNRSHDDLPPKDRKVKVYRYAALAPPSAEVDSIDLVKYKVAEAKDRSIKQMERSIKKAAFDCALNRERNILSKKNDGSRKCDYLLCDYKCKSGPIPKETDITTWDLSINKHDLDRTKEQIKKLFLINFFWKLEQIHQALNDIDPLLVSVALDDILSKNESLKDEFDRNGNLIYRGDYYIFQPSGMSLDASLAERSQGPMGVPKGNLKIFLRRLEKEGKKTLEPPKPILKPKPIPKSISKNIGRKINEIPTADRSFNDNIIQNEKVYATKYNRSGVWDDKFRIVDLRGQTLGADQRKKVSGQACSSTPVKKLQDIAKVLGAKNEDIAKLKRAGLCTLLEALFVQNKLMLK